MTQTPREAAEAMREAAAKVARQRAERFKSLIDKIAGLDSGYYSEFQLLSESVALCLDLAGELDGLPLPAPSEPTAEGREEIAKLRHERDDARDARDRHREDWREAKRDLALSNAALKEMCADLARMKAAMEEVRPLLDDIVEMRLGHTGCWERAVNARHAIDAALKGTSP